MRPCDCKDQVDIQNLNEYGITFNNDSLIVIPNRVELYMHNVKLTISMKRFKQFAEWYLKDQVKE